MITKIIIFLKKVKNNNTNLEMQSKEQIFLQNILEFDQGVVDWQ